MKHFQQQQLASNLSTSLNCLTLCSWKRETTEVMNDCRWVGTLSLHTLCILSCCCCLHLLETEKKNQEKRVWEKQKMGKVQCERMCITPQQNQREIQHSLRTQREGGIWRHAFFTECKAKLITVSFNSRKKDRKKEYFKAQQDTLDTTCGALQDSCIDQNIKSEHSELQNKQKQKPPQFNIWLN